MIQTLNSTEQQLISIVNQYVPGAFGEVRFPMTGELCLMNNNADAIFRLYQSVKAQFPEAGDAYHRIRSWGMIIWQPVILSVFATHALGMHMHHEYTGHKVQGAQVSGFSLGDGSLSSSRQIDLFPLIEANGLHLKRCLEHFFSGASSIFAIEELEARRFSADRILSTLLSLRGPLVQMDNTQFSFLGEKWLESVGLSKQSGFKTVVCANGEELLELDRKGCCLHFRTRNGELCSSCPRKTKRRSFHRHRNPDVIVSSMNLKFEHH